MPRFPANNADLVLRRQQLPMDNTLMEATLEICGDESEQDCCAMLITRCNRRHRVGRIRVNELCRLQRLYRAQKRVSWTDTERDSLASEVPDSDGERHGPAEVAPVEDCWRPFTVEDVTEQPSWIYLTWYLA